jgi:AmmeMemoRadiSam system protein A
MKPCPLTEPEKRALLGLARSTIASWLGRPDAPPADDALPDGNGGAFVSLHRRGTLRGCIGTFATDQPVVATVRDMAVAAASSDPRFPPLGADELDDVDLEISVLSPRWRATSIDEIQVGVHGLSIQRGAHRGVLLPQVATRFGWDRETFLEETCRKAGLPADAWRDPATRLELFTAEVFAEDDPA